MQMKETSLCKKTQVKLIKGRTSNWADQGRCQDLKLFEKRAKDKYKNKNEQNSENTYSNTCGYLKLCKGAHVTLL